jgi:Zn-dependent protease with chaperone function
MENQFPDITIDGQTITAKDHVAKGTKKAFLFAFLIASVSLLVGIVVTWGVLLIILLCYPIVSWFLEKRAMALIHGSGVHIDENQFPEIFHCVETFKKRLGLEKDVEIYLMEDNVSNAFAVKYGKKDVILLTDDLIHGCLASNNPHALSFVIGHELGHIALNHTGLLRSWVGKNLKHLGRLDEYSADAVALALVEDKNIAFRGLLLLTVGYGMMRYVNLERLVEQSHEVATNKLSKKAEKQLTHPLLLNRLNKVVQA